MPLFPPVLVPTPSITASPSTGALYAGTSLSLTCNYTLNPSVNTAPQTAVVWMVGGAAVDTSPGRISATGDTLSFSPLATSDTGNYTCELTVTAQQTHVTVQAPQQSAVEDITVQGNVLYCMIIHSLFFIMYCAYLSLPTDLPAPEVASVVDSTVTAEDSHTLQCTVTEIPHLAVQPNVELIGPGGSLATAMGLMLTHTVDPVKTSDAGQYTCMASVVIPSASVDVSGQSSSTLTVQSESMEMMFN